MHIDKICPKLQSVSELIEETSRTFLVLSCMLQAGLVYFAYRTHPEVIIVGHHDSPIPILELQHRTRG